jgi:dolichol-phosphate mannosyltransferase
MTSVTTETPVLSLVSPTYNEAGGLENLVTQVHKVMDGSGISYELIIVDDNSPDGTAKLAETLATEFPVRVLRRPGKLGLSSAVMDGWSIARGSVLGVIDADMSHDPLLLPWMVRSVTDGDAEVAVGSRYIPGGGMGNWPLYRQIVSRVAVKMGSLICPVKDVTSGYLIMRKSVIDGVKLNPIGFKIGLELLVRGRYSTFTELPYTFQDRALGSSKLGLKVMLQYIIQLKQLIIHSVTHPQKRRRVAAICP